MEGRRRHLRRHGLKQLEGAKAAIGLAKAGGSASPALSKVSKDLDRLRDLLTDKAVDRLYGQCLDFCARFTQELAETYEKPVEVGFDFAGSRNEAAKHSTLLSGAKEGSRSGLLRQPMHDHAQALGPLRLVECGPDKYDLA